MKSVAIVEDDNTAAENLGGFIKKFAENYKEDIVITRFADGIAFLTNYSPKYDIIFMDIEMPDLNGMDTAAKLREIDNIVTLIFVTNMAQYAVKGYEVGAFDYIVKPVTYANFIVKFRRALENVKLRGEYKVQVVTGDGVICVNASELKYIEVMNHKLIYHTVEKDIVSYGQLKKIEAPLLNMGFARCNSCYLVNLRFVSAINGFTAVVGGDELTISHARKKDFMIALADYLGGVGGG